MNERQKHEETISFLLEKSKKKEIAKPDIPLRNPKKDGNAKPYLLETDEKEIRKIEKFTRELAAKIK